MTVEMVLRALAEARKLAKDKGSEPHFEPPAPRTFREAEDRQARRPDQSRSIRRPKPPQNLTV